MENTKLSLKVQFNDKVKRLLEKEYACLGDLKEVIQTSFKNLRPESYVLKYLDNEDDWLYIIDDSDLEALKEYSEERNGKSIKLVIESQEDLAQSTVEPKRFNQSQIGRSEIKDSCVAEVEAFLKQQEQQQVQNETESLKKIDESEMDVEIVDVENKRQEDSSESVEIVDALRKEFENARISEAQLETQPDTVREERNLEPVIIEEEKVPEPAPVEDDEEEVIDTSNHDQKMEAEEPKPELKNFSILECLQNVENVLNDTENDVNPKAVFKAVKESAKGTKAEQNIKKMCKKMKGGKGFFMKHLMKKLFNKGKCGEKNSGVIHRGITCDGCNARPIVGVRYKCSECPDFDLCQDCEAKDVHNHHVFLKLKTPMGVDIIYSHRTDDPVQPPADQPEPQFSSFGHGWNNNGHGHGHHGHGHHGHGHHGHGHGFGPHRGHGFRGGRGGPCGKNWQQNNPLMQMFKQFVGGEMGDFIKSDSEDSDHEKKPKKERKKCWDLRPVITKQPSEPILGSAGGMQIIETTIQNQSPWPYRLNYVKMVDGDKEIQFQNIETDVVLKHNESQDFCLAVQLPEKAGKYSASFGFINHKGKMQGQQLKVEFQVVED